MEEKEPEVKKYITRKAIEVHHYTLKEIDFEMIVPPVMSDLNVREITTVKEDDMRILIESIEEHGLYIPLIVVDREGRYYEVVDGQRRS